MNLTIEFDGAALPFELSQQGEEWRFRLQGSEERCARVREAEPAV